MPSCPLSDELRNCGSENEACAASNAEGGSREAFDFVLETFGAQKRCRRLVRRGLFLRLRVPSAHFPQRYDMPLEYSIRLTARFNYLQTAGQ